MRENSILFAQFCCEPNIALKKKLKEEKNLGNHVSNFQLTPFSLIYFFISWI